jgi:murein DD-endopeptidase MepM/ murein hydrolase activator NlpD
MWVMGCIRKPQVRTQTSAKPPAAPKKLQVAQKRSVVLKKKQEDKQVANSEYPTHQSPRSMQLRFAGESFKPPATVVNALKTPVPTAKKAEAPSKKPQQKSKRSLVAKAPKKSRKKKRSRHIHRHHRHARRTKRSRKRWRRRKRLFVTKRVVRWVHLLKSIRGAAHYFTSRDIRRVYRSVRWKYRRAKRKYHSIPRALRRDIIVFLIRLKRLRTKRKRFEKSKRKGRWYRKYRTALAKFQGKQTKGKLQCTILPKPRPRYAVLCNRSFANKQKKRRWGRYGNRLYPFFWPARSRYIASKFGWRKGPFSGRRGFHSGLDIAAKQGSSVYAAASGIVVSAGWYGGCGLTIYVQHRNGLRTGYCHLSSINVRKGKWVYRGQQIGKAGSTGSATAPHLHFTVKRGRKYLNPIRFLRGQWRPKRRKKRKRTTKLAS